MNNEKTVCPSNDLTDDDCRNIEDYENQHKQTNRNNSFYPLVDNKLQSSPHLQDQNKTDDLKTTKYHEGELVMAYDTNNGNSTLCPRILYALHVRPNDNGIGHLIFNLSTSQILITMKYQIIHVPENLIKVNNKKDSFTNKIQVNHFNSYYFTAQGIRSDNNKDDSQTWCNDENIFEATVTMK